MFETLETPSYGSDAVRVVARYVAQLILCYPLTGLIGVPLFLALPKLGLRVTIRGASSLVATKLTNKPALPPPAALCASPMSGSAQLPVYTAVEILGQHTCSGGRLLPSNVIPLDAFTVERVRLLEGPSAKQEGWILSYVAPEVR